jgi:hypothetical protein
MVEYPRENSNFYIEVLATSERYPYPPPSIGAVCVEWCCLAALVRLRGGEFVERPRVAREELM